MPACSDDWGQLHHKDTSSDGDDADAGDKGSDIEDNRTIKEINNDGNDLCHSDLQWRFSIPPMISGEAYLTLLEGLTTRMALVENRSGTPPHLQFVYHPFNLTHT